MNRKMHIAIIEPDFHIRKTLVDLIHNTQVSGALVLSDFSSLEGFRQFNRKKALSCLFISNVPDKHITGPEFIRYLNRYDKLSLCCKCILLSKTSDYSVLTSVYRSLIIPVVPLPLSSDLVGTLLNDAQISTRLFRPLFEEMERLPAAEMVRRVRGLEKNRLGPTQQDELRLLKVRILLMAKKPQLALSVAGKITDDVTSLREQLYIHHYTGNRNALLILLDDEGQPIIRHSRVYYRALLKIYDRDYQGAEKTFRDINVDTMQVNELETLALLMTKQGNYEKADDILKLAKTGHPADNILSFEHNVARLRCLGLRLMYSPDEQSSKTAFIEIKRELSQYDNNELNTEAKQNKFFIQLGLFLFTDKEMATDFYQKLIQKIDTFDIGQLSILLLAANLLNKEDDARIILRHTEKRLAVLEISPELLSFEIFSNAMMRHTITPDQRYNRLVMLASMHLSADRNYRALQKYDELARHGEDLTPLKENITLVMQQSEAGEYWALSRALEGHMAEHVVD